ncbi:MAG: hypothetical protein AB1810_02945 [Pseudomonadota bacterium]
MTKRLLLTICVTGVFMTTGAQAFTPIQVNGAISYNHRLSQSGGSDTTTQYIQGDIGFRSFIWQPWFILWSLDLSKAFTDTESESYSSEDNVWSGDLGLDVFSRSRFPFTLSLSRYHSAISNVDEHSLVDFDTTSTSTKLRLNQAYSALSGSYYNAWYNAAKWESEAVSEVSTENVGVAGSMRFVYQTLQLNFNDVETDLGGGAGSDGWTFTATHLFSPGPDFSATSAFSMSNDETRSFTGLGKEVTTSDDVNASSSLYWRPEYSDLSMNVAVRFRHTEAGSNNPLFEDAVTRDLNLALGVNYRLTRKIRLFASVSAGITEEEGGSRIGNSSQVLGGSFNSDAYYFGKTIWRWNSSLSGSNTLTRGGGMDDSTQALNAGLGHTLSRSWLVSRVSNISFMFSQGVSGSKTSDGGEVSKSMANSARLTFTQSDRSGSTSAWLTVQDNRSLDDDSSQQQLLAQISRSQTMSRVSSLNGNLSYNWSRQDQPETITADSDQERVSKGGSGSMSYVHGRVFGVYRLQFNSLLSLQQASAYAGEKVIASKWDNNLTYNIGLLSAGLSYNLIKQEGRPTYITRLFRVTRRF